MFDEASHHFGRFVRWSRLLRVYWQILLRKSESQPNDLWNDAHRYPTRRLRSGGMIRCISVREYRRIKNACQLLTGVDFGESGNPPKAYGERALICRRPSGR